MPSDRKPSAKSSAPREDKPKKGFLSLQDLTLGPHRAGADKNISNDDLKLVKDFDRLEIVLISCSWTAAFIHESWHDFRAQELANAINSMGKGHSMLPGEAVIRIYNYVTTLPHDKQDPFTKCKLVCLAYANQTGFLNIKEDDRKRYIERLALFRIHDLASHFKKDLADMQKYQQCMHTYVQNQALEKTQRDHNLHAGLCLQKDDCKLDLNPKVDPVIESALQSEAGPRNLDGSSTTATTQAYKPSSAPSSSAATLASPNSKQSASVAAGRTDTRASPADDIGYDNSAKRSRTKTISRSVPKPDQIDARNQAMADSNSITTARPTMGDGSYNSSATSSKSESNRPPAAAQYHPNQQTLGSPPQNSASSSKTAASATPPTAFASGVGPERSSGRDRKSSIHPSNGGYVPNPQQKATYPPPNSVAPQRVTTTATPPSQGTYSTPSRDTYPQNQSPGPVPSVTGKHQPQYAQQPIERGRNERNTGAAMQSYTGAQLPATSKGEGHQHGPASGQHGQVNSRSNGRSQNVGSERERRGRDFEKASHMHRY